MTLPEFCTWYKSLNFPKNTNQWSGKIFYTDCSSSTIVFVHENFLVEEYHLFPSAVVPLHNHPFDTLSIFLGGEFMGYRETIDNRRLYNERDIGVIGAVLPAGANHGFIVGPEGASLLVVGKWDNLDQRNSATIVYNGQYMGPQHEKLIEKHKHEQATI